VTEPERERLIELLKKHVDEMGEHFDAIQVLVSTHESDEGTWTYAQGYGNWNARLGMAQAFLNRDAQKDQARCIASEMHSDDDGA
jgi:hypothetical protein